MAWLLRPPRRAYRGLLASASLSVARSEGLEIVHSLQLMDGDLSAVAALNDLASTHPAHAVREAAGAALERRSGAPASSSDKQPAG
jgi:hypothetical protein